ncbi:MAG TPA: hypothetical protein V6D22_21155 [Candidatus Obscuribacterales bacterium]
MSETDPGVIFGVMILLFAPGMLLGYLLQVFGWAILAATTNKVAPLTWPAVGMGLFATGVLSIFVIISGFMFSSYLEAHKLGFWMFATAVMLGAFGATGGACLPVPSTDDNKENEG